MINKKILTLHNNLNKKKKKKKLCHKIECCPKYFESNFTCLNMKTNLFSCLYHICSNMILINSIINSIFLVLNKIVPIELMCQSVM